MISKASAKHQKTISKTAPGKPGISSSDALEQVEGKCQTAVLPVNNNFRSYQNSVNTGVGDIAADIQTTRKNRLATF